MDINSILENATVKSVLQKAGVSEAQAKSVANQAITSIQSKFSNHPKQMSSLLSDNPNTPEDESLKSEVKDDFLSRLVSKVGLSEENASKVTSAMPDILSSFSSHLSSADKNNDSGIAAFMDNITDMFDGDMDNDGKKDEGGIIGGLKNKFFG